MKRFLAQIFIVISIMTSPARSEEVVYARLQTSEGNIDLALYPEKAPITVENFVQYAESGYYIRMIFHRVVKDVLIQSGSFSKYYTERNKRDPIQNEADNGLLNKRGTVAMARYTEPHSATSAFFLNVQDNPRLDHQGKDLMMQWGYTVFGEVVAGLEVVDAIANVQTGPGGHLERDVPVEQIILERVDIIDASEVGVVWAE